LRPQMRFAVCGVGHKLGILRSGRGMHAEDDVDVMRFALSQHLVNPLPAAVEIDSIGR
jgi:hypothetical protein